MAPRPTRRPKPPPRTRPPTRTPRRTSGLVTPERLGDVVAPVKVKLAKKDFTFHVATPKAPGRYRLTVTLHDKDGVAFDAATQALLPTLIVRVTGDLDAEVVAPTAIELPSGSASSLALWVANLGTSAWGHEAFADPRVRSAKIEATSARLTAQWVALGGLDDEAQLASAAAAAATPGHAAGGPGAGRHRERRPQALRPDRGR